MADRLFDFQKWSLELTLRPLLQAVVIDNQFESCGVLLCSGTDDLVTFQPTPATAADHDDYMLPTSTHDTDEKGRTLPGPRGQFCFEFY